MQDFRQLRVWQKAFEFARTLYQLTSGFPVSERYGLVTQLRRAGVSIGANIAEGAGRDSRRDFARHLDIASGSVNEIDHLLMIAHMAGYMDSARLNELVATASDVRRMIWGLARRLRGPRKTDDG